MNKKEIAAAVADRLHIKKYEAYNFAELLIETICEQLAAGRKVVISRFGTFYVKAKQSKRVINPQSRKPMFIAPTHIVKFIPSRRLKQMLR